jgi:Xaa-Pro aminopeptidase/dienelactone hydrolase
MNTSAMRGLTAAAAVTFLALAVTPSPVMGQSDVALPSSVYAERRVRLAEQTGDAAVIIPGAYLVGAEGLFKQDPDFWYLTGVESPYAVLVMTKQAGALRTTLFLPEEYQFAGGQFPMADEGFRRAVWNRPVGRLAPGKAAAVATGITESYPLAELDTRLRALATAQDVYVPQFEEPLYAPPGFDAPRSVSAQIVTSITRHLSGKTFKNVTPLIRRMRLVKDAYEIAALRKAAEISGYGLVTAMRTVRAGLNDRDVAGLMESAWKQAGSPRAAFAPIVASGPNSMTFFSLMSERYNSVDHTMRDGELLFIDYGAAEYQTYAADLCRTLPVSGTFTPDQRKYYEIVLEAQQAAIDRIQPGVMMLDAIKAAAEVFRKHGLGRYEDIAVMGEDKVWGIMPSPTHYLTRNAGLVPYTPRGGGVRDLGHHIGLRVHDSRDYSRPLETGMVVTVEPKIYIPEKQIAIMIEDMVLVTPSGHEVLSDATYKKPDDIERVMRSARNPALAKFAEVVTFPSGVLMLHGVLWKPEGTGPFPAVVYNHGSDAWPSDLHEIGPLYARHGYVLFGPIRRGQGRSVGVAPYMNGQLIAERKAHGDAAWGRLMVKLHETEQLDDQLAGIAYLKSLPYVDPQRIAVTGVSFGGIQTLLAAERDCGIRAAVDFAGAAMTWDSSPEIRARLLSAVRNARVPIYFIQAENDYNLGPSRTLAAEMERVGKPHRMKIYPPFGTTTQEGHGLGLRGSRIWESDVFTFLDECMK